MKVVLVLSPYYMDKGGISAFVKNQKKNVRIPGYRFIYHAIRRDYKDVLRTLFTIRSYLLYVLRLGFSGIDIVHGHPSDHRGFIRFLPFFFTAFLLRKKVVIHIHGSEFEDFYRQSSRIQKCIIRFTLRRAKAVVALSELRAIFLRDMGITSIQVINNTVQTLEQNPFKTDAVIVSFLGFLCTRKGIYDLLEAIPIVIENHPSAMFYLGGCETPGSGDEAKIKRTIEQKGIHNNIRLLGWIDDRAKSELLSMSGVFVLPSYNEGLPISLLEAMAYGVPVVTTPVGGIGDLVEDGVNGFLVAPGNIQQLSLALVKLLSDTELRRSISYNNYKKIINEFSNQALTERLAEMYERID